MPNADEHLLDTIYAAALDPDLWSHVVEQLGAMTGGEATALTRLDIVTGAGSALATNNNERTLTDYFDYYYRINPLQLVDDPVSYVEGWAPTILRDEDWLDRSVLEKSEYYNDFLRPICAQWGMILRLGLAGHEVTTISIGRRFQRGRFEDAEIAAAARFHPHLIRAFGLSERFVAAQRRTNGLAAAIDLSRSVMMLVDADARMLHANAAAERLFRAGDTLRLVDGRLSAADAASDRALANAIADAAALDRHRRIGGTFALRVPNRLLPLKGAVMPLLEDDSGVFGRRCAALVSLTDPIADSPTAPEAMQAVFGFTAAETRLAIDLLNGLDLRASAAQRGISINTVRTQLASLFAKTETNRQINLVQLLATFGIAGFDG